MYIPEEWIIVKISGEQPHYRVFASWRGGYLSGDSWRMNSGITSLKEEKDYYLFYGKSGSIYKCHKNLYGIKSPYNNSVLCSYKIKYKDIFEIIQELPDLIKIDWLLKPKNNIT